MSPASKCVLCGAVLVDSTATLCPRCEGIASSAALPTRSFPLEPSNSNLASTAPPASIGVTVAPDLDRKGKGELGGRIGRFEVRNWLGEGSFADVYLAHDPQIDREVALKVAKSGTLDTPRRIQRFLNEARSLGRLRHPSIVPLYEFGEDHGRYYLVSAYIPGRTLGDVIFSAKESGAALPFPDIARIVRQLAEALAHAHAMGLVHRDVKPHNIMIADTGEPLLMDFGLAIRADGDEGNDPYARPASAVGTPAYMAPEQTGAGHGEVTSLADQYALGCTFFEMLTGRLPFSGSTDSQLRLRRTQPSPSPREFRQDTPRDLEMLCLRCLEKDPRNRFAAISELAEELQRWERGEPIRTRRRSRWEIAQRWLSRNRMKVAAVAVLAFAVLAGVAASRYNEPERQLERTLRAGRPAVLVSEKGWPKWHEWYVGDALPAESVRGDGSAGFQTLTTSLLVLVRDPMHESYRFSAELKHCEENAEDSAVGMFVSLVEFPLVGGVRVSRSVAVHFSDYWSEAEWKRPDQRRFHALRIAELVTVRNENGIETTTHHLKAHNFTPKHTAPFDWRTLVLDVSPSGLAVSWRKGDDPLEEVLRISIDEINALSRIHTKVVAAKRPGASIPEADWNPRGALGMYARSAAIAFKNVKVEPNVPHPERRR